MRVHQPGGHLMRQRSAEVDDWSWATTRKRLGVLWRLTKRYPTRTLFSAFSLLTATAAALAPPLLARYALEDAISDRTGSRLVLVVAIFIAAGLANWGMTYVETYMTGWVGERILADLRTELFGHLQRLSLGFYERNRAGVLISRMTNDVEAIDQLVTDGVTTLAQSTLLLTGTAVLLFVFDWRLALATLAVIPFMSIASALFRSRSARAYADVRERLGLVTATLAEDIAGETGKAYKTKGGKTVYGGGGITPDVFVALDTTALNPAIGRLYDKNTIGNFVYRHYIDHITTFQAFKTPEEFEKGFHPGDDLMNSLMQFAMVDGIDLKVLSNRERQFLKDRVKTLMARQLWRSEGFYEVNNVNDPMIKKALSVINP